MTRRQDWPERLADELKAARGRPSSWGQHDCCAFAARVVLAMTDRDFRGAFDAYSTAAGAQALLAAQGGVRGIATRCLGEPVGALQARRGDVVVVDSSQGEALGICDGRNVWVPAPESGLTRLPIEQALAAWRVD